MSAILSKITEFGASVSKVEYGGYVYKGKNFTIEFSREKIDFTPTSPTEYKWVIDKDSHEISDELYYGDCFNTHYDNVSILVEALYMQDSNM